MMIDTLRRKLIRKYCLVLLVLLTYVSAATAGADEQVAIELQAVQHTAGELSSHERLYRLLDIMWTWQMENYPELDSPGARSRG